MTQLTVRRTTDLIPQDKRYKSPFPITSVERTLVDLGGVVLSDDLEVALDSALRRRLTTVSRLRRRLNLMQTRGRPGPAALARLLGERSGASLVESPIETRFSRLVRSSDLPHPISQYEVKEEGSVVARVDLAYPHCKLAVELDGYAYHHGKRAWLRDLERRSALARLGWRVMHVAASDLADPDEVVAGLRAALFPNLSL